MKCKTMTGKLLENFRVNMQRTPIQVGKYSLFLAVELGIYENFFVNPEVLELIETEDLKVMVFDKLKEVIVRWIN